MATSHPNDWGFDPGNWPSDDQQWNRASRELRGALEDAAQLRKTLTYADAANAVRSMELDAVSVRLAHLLCKQIKDDVADDLPLLSSLVIGKWRNQPGQGFFRFARQYFRFQDDEVFWLAELEAVYNHYGRRGRRRGTAPRMSHRIALPNPQKQRPEDQGTFIMSFFD